MKVVPSREQVQAWVRDIEPYGYFERLADGPGLLMLRVKGPICQWRGLHLALSDERRERLRDQLTLLADGRADRLQYQTSVPDGRAWFHLRTSGVDFGFWRESEFELDSEASASEIWLHYANSTVHLRLSSAAASTLAGELSQSLEGGIKSTLAIVRDIRPSSPPQALWLWRWQEERSAV